MNNSSTLKYLKRTGSQWSINSLKTDTLDIVKWLSFCIFLSFQKSEKPKPGRKNRLKLFTHKK